MPIRQAAGAGVRRPAGDAAPDAGYPSDPTSRGLPWPIGTVCPLTGDVEDREGVCVLRFSEVHETGLAREVCAGHAGDFGEAEVFVYDPATNSYSPAS